MKPSTSRTISASAVTSLALGLLGWGLLLVVIVAHNMVDELIILTGFVAALLSSLCAIVFAHRARAASRAHPETGGHQVALAGLMLGWSATVLAILLAVFAMIVVFSAMLFFMKLFS